VSVKKGSRLNISVVKRKNLNLIGSTIHLIKKIMLETLTYPVLTRMVLHWVVAVTVAPEKEVPVFQEMMFRKKEEILNRTRINQTMLLLALGVVVDV